MAGIVKSYYPCIEEDWPILGGRVWKLGWLSCGCWGWNPALLKLDWSWGTNDPWGWKPLLKFDWSWETKDPCGWKPLLLSWGTTGDWGWKPVLIEDPEGLTLNN